MRLSMSIRMKINQKQRTTMLKWHENIKIINEHQLNKDNTKALIAIAMIESVYESKKIFDDRIFQTLRLLESGEIDHLLNEAANDEHCSRRLVVKFDDNDIHNIIQIIVILIQMELPINKGLSRQCTNVKWSDDVVVMEFGIHKVTLLKYEDKFRLLHIHNKDKKKTTTFQNYFFKSSEEIFTYMNNIDEYAEFNADVLEMIRF